MNASNPTIAAAFVGRSLTILDGTVATDPRVQNLSTGDVVEFDVATQVWPGGPKKLVVTVVSALSDGSESPVQSGDRVVVIGASRRRFYRAGGSTISRTEVEASRVVVGNVRTRRAAIAQAFAWFTDQG